MSPITLLSCRPPLRTPDDVPASPPPSPRLQRPGVPGTLAQEPPAQLVPPPSPNNILHLLCKRPRHCRDRQANLGVAGSNVPGRGPRHMPLLLQPKQQDRQQLFQARLCEADLPYSILLTFSRQTILLMIMTLRNVHDEVFAWVHVLACLSTFL